MYCKLCTTYTVQYCNESVQYGVRTKNSSSTESSTEYAVAPVFSSRVVLAHWGPMREDDGEGPKNWVRKHREGR